jgi:predicted RecB family nuclease
VHARDGQFALSATDLSSFLGCRHRTALDMSVALGKLQPVYYNDPLLDLLIQRGLEHERRFVDSLRVGDVKVVDLAAVENNAERLARTRAAMREGADVIVQGAFADGAWNGRPDILRRVAQASALGAWSYEVYDTKLARETKAGTILQLSLYSELLSTAQGLLPDFFHVVTPTAGMNLERYRVNDYAAYYRSVRDQLLRSVTVGDIALAAQNYPEPVDQCDVCRWRKRCSDQRRADDHLSLVAGISRGQRRELQDHGISKLVELARTPWPLPFKPRRDSLRSYDRVRDQARLQLASRGATTPEYELLPVVQEKGLCRLPEPSPGDLFLDLEGDPFVGEAGREYLFGVVAADGSYESAWALTDVEEHHAFERVIDRIVLAARAHPDMHVYHYAPYEPAAFTRLMGRYATREREFEAMLRAGRFIDLYAVVRQSMRAGVERYSIKNLEPLYAFTRDVALDDANRRLRQVEYALESGAAAEMPAEARSIVEGYNRDDCVSTRALRDWLEAVRARRIESGIEIPRPPLDPSDGKAPDKVDERAQKVDALRSRLLLGVPEESGERTAEQQARWLLAYSLDYHRREERVGWATHFRLCESPDEDLYDKPEAIAGLELAGHPEPVRHKKTGKPTGSMIDRYSFPPQETEVGRGATVWLSDKKQFGEVVAIDRIAHTIDIKKGSGRAAVHPTAVCAYKHVPTDEMADALWRIGDSVAAGRDDYGAAWSLLRGEAPRLVGDEFGNGADESPPDRALRVANLLDRTVLPIQGPPGAGKTFLGARMICALVKAGKRVGVVATSHKVIRLLLDSAADAARESGASVAAAHRCDDDELPGAIRCVDTNEDALQALASGDVNVLGGTAWLWSRAEFAGAVDVLFVDEAGQMSLANVIAVSQAADSVVLLGDPQQLEQPRKGSHPDGVEVSALEHVLAGRRTIPSDRGIFLRETWRLAPSICRFTSDVFYDGRLTPHAGMELQRVSGVDGLPESGLVIVPVAHDGNRNYAPEEIDAVAELIHRLTAPGAQWTNDKGDPHRLVGSDIVVVAPYNAQVTRLTERLAGAGVPVGTVDKFQGQQAPVAIYSMATSSIDEAPRGMEFLLSLNRLNVATSRAKCLAILVASPRLLDIECRTPRQMQLANALCRFRELAAPIAQR